MMAHLDTVKVRFYSLPARCDICDRRWVAVYPESCERIECPTCSHMTRAPHLTDDDDEDEVKEPWQA